MERQNIKKLLLEAFGFVSKLIYQFCIRPLDNILLSMLSLDHSNRQRKILAWFKDLAWLFFTCFRARVEQWDDPEWSIIFIHDGCAHSKEELFHLLFLDPPTEHNLGGIFLWQVPSVIKNQVRQRRLVICDLNRLLHWGPRFCYSFRVPTWLRANLDVSEPKDVILDRITKNRRRWISKLPNSDFSYKFSQQPEDFETFYHEMYVPHVTKRHQKRAIIEPIETKRATFEKGGLILVKYKGQPVAAGLRHIVKDTLIAGAFAIHQDHCHLIKQSVAVALHWFTIDWAYRNQLQSIDLGMTRPRLKDGVLEYKRQWGACFERDILTHTIWTFIGQGLPKELIRHLNDLAFIAQVGNEYQCVVLMNNDETDLSDEEFTQRKKLATKARLGGLLVLSETEPSFPQQEKAHNAQVSF